MIPLQNRVTHRRRARVHVRVPALVVAAIAAAALFITRPAEAAERSLTITVQVSNVDPGITAVNIGDRFTIDLTIEDATVDTNADLGLGRFGALVTNFTVTADPANTGAWTPAGIFNLAAGNYVTNAFGDNFTFEIGGAGFPDGGPGLTFNEFRVSFQWRDDIIDNGTGQTFAQLLGPTPFGVPSAIEAAGGEIVFEDEASDLVFAELALLEVPAVELPGLFVIAALVAMVASLHLMRARGRVTARS